MITKNKYQSISEFSFEQDPQKCSQILGIGSMGEVKLARHKNENKLYAIKIVNIIINI